MSQDLAIVTVKPMSNAIKGAIVADTTGGSESDSAGPDSGATPSDDVVSLEPEPTEEEPESPEEPEAPAEPGVPEEPEEPAAPAEPEVPEEPAAPTEPEVPEEPAAPA